MRIKTVSSIADRLKGLTVLVRASLNVPIVNGEVANPFRISAAVRTISFLAARGARVVLISHIGDVPTASLRPVGAYLNKSVPLAFVDGVTGDAPRAAVHAMRDGDVLLLENLRRDPGEVANDDGFARRLAALGDVFVNDDFAAAHRMHASVVGLPKYLPTYAGLQFAAEVEGLSRALSPQSPSLAILGGAKFLTKEPLIRALLKSYDQVFVGGALATDFFKAQGLEVGRSVASRSPHIADLLHNSKILLPSDVVVASPLGREVKRPEEVRANDCIYDVGPASVAQLQTRITRARSIVWNGPMGDFEKGYREATEELARLVATAPGFSVVGGGDTIAAIHNLGLNDRFGFLSTAGGAMLDFLAHGTVPGILAINASRSID
ncbi:phosphoglycerate kinase [Patescibacteria group bacterium]|nr:phosphoglycerate kinase [Patescibacteria group bacterium]